MGSIKGSSLYVELNDALKRYNLEIRVLELEEESDFFTIKKLELKEVTE